MTIDLKGARRIDWVRPSGCPSGFETKYVVLGNAEGGGIALEIAVADSKNQSGMLPRPLKDLHRIRLANRAIPLVLAIDTTDGVFIFGPNPEVAPNGPIPHEQAERFLQSVLDELTPVLARARLAALTQALDSTAMPGVKNSGLFANHELRVGVPARPDWQAACERSAAILSSKGPQLIEKLGYKVGRAGAHAMVLSGKGPHPQAIAVMLDEREAFDADSPRFAVSPVAYGLRMAEQQDVPWLIMLRGTQLRLYPARIEFGVGRKGLAETFFEVDLPQLTQDNAGYIDLIFSAAALDENGTAYEILKSSTQYAVELGERLRDKVYEEIIPDLALAIADALIERDYEMDAEGLDLAYQLTLRVFFRMLFQVYAEDRKLLPFGENTKYDRNAIKTMAKDFVENPDQEFDEDSTSLWDDLAQVWRVIDSGDRAWGVPAYNGGLFASDKEINDHGSILKDIHLSNAVMGPVLKALLLDEADDGEIGQIDFRSLSVREFGTIYEGLLESSLGLAEVNLTLDDKGTWIPAKKKDEVYAYAGQVYFHNTSGQRKGTGSYFTPSFVVEHLLERSLDPALDAHLERVKALLAKQDHAGAGELFFDFRVADLAMGSGHFLTSAIDHIEQRMAAFLAEDGNAIPGVTAELQKLERAATDALGPDAPEPERSSLLRRQIARRCIYGLDINPIAVELARVSIWIHTFVRGLPMSSLDHNLVCANSLTGIGSVEEALDVLVPGRKGKMTLFDEPIEDALHSARTVLIDASLLAESTKEESRAASRASRKALKEAEIAKLLFDAAVLTRIGRGDLVSAETPSSIAKMAGRDHVQTELLPLKPAHMPVLFPEVFLRASPGFDVLVGNPPWEGLHVRQDEWWNRRIPGLGKLNAHGREKLIEKYRSQHPELENQFNLEVDSKNAQRLAVLAGPYEGLGSGHVDLYQAFAWRNWTLIRESGQLALVMPRTALTGSGLRQWRRNILTSGSISDSVVLTNSSNWVFEGVEGRVSCVLMCVVRDGESLVNSCGPFFSYQDFEVGRKSQAQLSSTQIERMSDTFAVPIIGDEVAGSVMARMQLAPRFDLVDASWDFQPMRGDILNKGLFSAVSRAGYIKIFGGSSFHIWNPNFGKPYSYAEPVQYRKALLEKVDSASRNRKSAFHGLSDYSRNSLHIDVPRIAIRWIAKSSDTRTCIACLLPPSVGAVDSASVLVRRAGSEKSEAFLLAVLSSVIFDWYVRKWVEQNFTFELLKPAPIPRFPEAHEQASRLIEISGRLAAIDERYTDWAKAVGVKVGSVKSDNEKDLLIAEIDALVAHMYGLTRAQLDHIFKTFHRGWDYAPRLEKVLTFYDKLPEVAS